MIDSIFIITIQGNEQSEKSAHDCADSVDRNGSGIKPDFFDAFTPNDDIANLFEEKGLKPELWLTSNFVKPFASMSCFLSHFSLWEYCRDLNQTIMILEEDTVLINELPDDLEFDKVMTISKPSYKGYNDPSHIGVGPLMQGNHFLGSHGYVIKPEGAAALIEKATTDYPNRLDDFFNLNDFPWLEEYYPWVVISRDTYSRITTKQGAQKKQNFTNEYRLI